VRQLEHRSLCDEVGRVVPTVILSMFNTISIPLSARGIDPGESMRKGWLVEFPPLTDVAIHGKVRFVRVSASWRDERTYDSPTWKQVLIAAERSIKDTEDLHHIYLERMEEVHGRDGETTVDLWFGS
jgi:hypothetical protein